MKFRSKKLKDLKYHQRSPQNYKSSNNGWKRSETLELLGRFCFPGITRAGSSGNAAALESHMLL